MQVLNLTDGKKLLLVDIQEVPRDVYISDYVAIIDEGLRRSGVLNTLVGVHDSKQGTKKSRIPRKLKKCIQESYKKIMKHEKNKMDCRSKE